MEGTSNASRCVITLKVYNSCSLPVFSKASYVHGVGFWFVYDSGMKIVVNHETKTKAPAKDPGVCLPPISPPTLHTTPTYGLIPFQNTSNQTNNV